MAEDVRGVTRLQAAALVIGVIAIFGLSLVAGVGRNSPVQEEPRKTEAGPPSSWSGLGLGALVGALIGALSTHLLQQRREHQRDLSERDALWILVRTEMLTNAAVWQVTDQLVEEPSENPMDLVLQRLEQELSVRTWEDVRVRLAQLLSSDDFHLLVNYYSNLQLLLEDVARIRSEPEFPDFAPWEKLAHVGRLNAMIRLLSEMERNAIVRLDRLTGEREWPEQDPA